MVYYKVEISDMKRISIWRDTAYNSTYSSLQENCITDVVLIGAGITGITAAYAALFPTELACFFIFLEQVALPLAIASFYAMVRPLVPGWGYTILAAMIYKNYPNLRKPACYKSFFK